MSTAEEERFDAIFLGLAQQMQGGVPQLMDTYFSFLRRKTDFYVGGNSGQAKEMVLKYFDLHNSKAQDVLRETQKKQAAEKKRKMEQEEKEKNQPRVVEIDEEEEKKILAEQSKKVTEPQAELPKPTPMDDDDDVDEKDKGKLRPNAGNGSSTETYSWTQTLGELEFRIPLPKGTTAKQSLVEVKATTLKIGLKGKEPIVSGEFHQKVKVAELVWVMEDSVVVISIAKFNQMEWWPRLLVGEHEINTRKIQPENSNIEDLDPETRGMVQKMRFDTDQKQKGLPTSDELQKNDLLKNFMAQHPEMDFSKAKIS